MVVIILHFFVQRPQLRCLIGRLSGYLFNNFALIGNNTLQQGRICFRAHRLIAITSHGQGYNAFIIVHPLNAFTPKLPELCFVGFIIPVFTTSRFPLGVCPHHGLVMRCSHYNAHFICQHRILRVVAVKTSPPHGRPEVIAFQPEDQLKYFFIKLVVKSAVIFNSPASECRFFIIQKNTPILYFGLV